LGFAQVYFGLKNFKRAEELIEKSLVHDKKHKSLKTNKISVKILE